VPLQNLIGQSSILRALRPEDFADGQFGVPTIKDILAELDKPGVDLGVLVDLIASCGGHLWLEAQPAGNMVLKIHLPKAPAAEATVNPGARASKWFRSTSAANVRA
jgi:hypothetical protein